ncbi:Protein NUCLEAR FUSION DEFECTIVE 4 [Bienertia sinuspersici]
MNINSAKSFTVQLLAGRFFVVFSTILILGFIGSAYIFGLYSGDIKTRLGLLMEVAPPWVVLSLGGVVNFFGYFMIWLSVTHRIKHPPVWLMCLYITIGANSLGFANTGGLVPCVQNFPENRGVVIGILKSYLGIGGAIMTQFYHALYGDDSDTSTVGVILIIAWLPALVSILFAFSVRVLDVSSRQIKRDNKEEFAIWKTKLQISNNSTLSELKIMPITHQPIIAAANPNSNSNAQNCWYKDVFSPPPKGEDHTILQATVSLDMQILFLATICGIGGNLATIDNLGQIGTSLGYPKKSISTFVSLVSIWQFLGRVMGGLISEKLLDKYNGLDPLASPSFY